MMMRAIFMLVCADASAWRFQEEVLAEFTYKQTAGNNWG
jgi:hypothetical protein